MVNIAESMPLGLLCKRWRSESSPGSFLFVKSSSNVARLVRISVQHSCVRYPGTTLSPEKKSLQENKKKVQVCHPIRLYLTPRGSLQGNGVVVAGWVSIQHNVPCCWSGGWMHHTCFGSKASKRRFSPPSLRGPTPASRARKAT